jgi:hypothetical protein
MLAMSKLRAGQAPQGEVAEGERPRRKRSTPPEANSAFLRAMADALRDILADEQHRTA